jgi:hypothetical protein
VAALVEPAKVQLWRPMVMGRISRSAALLDMHSRPSLGVARQAHDGYCRDRKLLLEGQR